MKVCTRVSVRWQQIVSVSFEFWGLLKKKAPQTLCSQSFRQAHFCKDGRKTDVFWTKIGALNGRKDGRISQIDGQNHKNTGIRRATFHKHSSRRARLSKDGRVGNTAVSTVLLHCHYLAMQLKPCNSIGWIAAWYLVFFKFYWTNFGEEKRGITFIFMRISVITICHNPCNRL